MKGRRGAVAARLATKNKAADPYLLLVGSSGVLAGNASIIRNGDLSNQIGAGNNHQIIFSKNPVINLDTTSLIVAIGYDSSVAGLPDNVLFYSEAVDISSFNISNLFAAIKGSSGVLSASAAIPAALSGIIVMAFDSVSNAVRLWVNGTEQGSGITNNVTGNLTFNTLTIMSNNSFPLTWGNLHIIAKPGGLPSNMAPVITALFGNTKVSPTLLV